MDQCMMGQWMKYGGRQGTFGEKRQQHPQKKERKMKDDTDEAKERKRRGKTVKKNQIIINMC